jgi:hypothetical protein
MQIRTPLPNRPPVRRQQPSQAFSHTHAHEDTSQKGVIRPDPYLSKLLYFF